MLAGRRGGGKPVAMRYLLLAALLAIGPASLNPCAAYGANAPGCCKVCAKGKPCGNSCIAKHLNCRKPPGCACAG